MFVKSPAIKAESHFSSDTRYPPYQYLKSVLTNCYKAGLLYMQLWEIADSNLRVTIKKDDIRSRLLTSPTHFRNDLSMLVREGLISAHETAAQWCVELVGWEDED